MSNEKPVRWADRAMFTAAPMERDEDEDWMQPKVHLLWMTEDPLGAIAAACRMYEGQPTYNLQMISDEERWHYAEQVQKTHLKAPLEFVKFHFFIEGVGRSFTHQIVRQRTAVFAQESLRFAVKENMATEAILPPSLHFDKDARKTFVDALGDIQIAYGKLLDAGIPAEDAREILPHAVSTRLHFCTDLRNLADHSGNRLCTQAQFIWRKVFTEILKSIQNHSVAGADLISLALFKPVCYQLGHCPFQASFDRGCTIRDRVELNAKHGVKSDDWANGHWVPGAKGQPELIEAIDTEEWLLDPQAGWVR